MATVTREQLNRWNAKLSNGFGFDVIHFLTWRDKQIKKYMELQDGRKLEAVLSYREVWENHASVGVKPVLHLSIWESCGPDSEMMRSCGMGAYIDMGEPRDKRNYNELVKLSAVVDDAKIKALAVEHMVQLKNEVII